MILSTLVTSQLHFEMCAGLYGHPVLILKHKTVYLCSSKNPNVPLKTQCVFLILLSILSKEIQGYMLICRNAEGVHGQRKVGNYKYLPLHLAHPYKAW